MKTSLFLILMIGMIGPAFGQSAKNNPIELGKVNWLRHFDEAITRSKAESKPVFILFQEVPGCATCQNYGKNVLSHPLIVEAIETHFIPLAIYNNKGGADAKVLQYYGEPSWNNPVVRIVDANKENLVPRLSGNYSQLGVVESMIFALQRADCTIPAYLELLRDDLRADVQGTETTTLSMYCFWTGEKQLGSLDGVVATTPGYMHGREVVLVEYNPEQISLEKIIERGKTTHCADQVFTDDANSQRVAAKVVGNGNTKAAGQFRQDKDLKYYLSRTHYRFVPMTAIQATRANALIGQGQSADAVLSPRQRELAAFVKAHPERRWKSVIGVDFEESWWKIVLIQP